MPDTTWEAFSEYEAVRHRLPHMGRQGRAERVASMDDIADRFDVFLLDAFGVLNIGESVIPGVPERVASLQDAGKTVMVVTNAASVPKDALLEKYRRFGYRFAPEHVMSSRQVLLDDLARKPDAHWGCMLPDASGQPDLSDLSLTVLDDDPSTYMNVDGFLLLGSGDWTPDKQAHLERALLDRPRPVLVGNPDIVAPREFGFSIEPGHYAHRLATRIGATPDFFGKPFGNVFDAVMRRLGRAQDPDRIVMVGDSLHTDILGASASGIRSALIEGFGFFAGHSATEAIERSGISPDYILARP